MASYFCNVLLVALIGLTAIFQLTTATKKTLLEELATQGHDISSWSNPEHDDHDIHHGNRSPDYRPPQFNPAIHGTDYKGTFSSLAGALGRQIVKEFNYHKDYFQGKNPDAQPSHGQPSYGQPHGQPSYGQAYDQAYGHGQHSQDAQSQHAQSEYARSQSSHQKSSRR